jgi:hypothetical protein
MDQIYGGYIGEYFELPSLGLDLVLTEFCSRVCLSLTRLTFSKVSVTVQGTPSTGSGERRKALTSPIPT